MAKNILLLGNGFDLLCNVKSRFSDYLNSIIEESWISKNNSSKVKHSVETCQNDLHKILISFGDKDILSNSTYPEQKLLDWIHQNYFYFLFLYYGYKKDSLWYDIENILKNFIDECNKNKCDVFLNVFLEKLDEYDEGLIRYSDFFTRVRNTLEKFYKKESKNWADWLEKSLNNFEQNFLNYIKAQTENIYSTYVRNAQFRMKQILSSLKSAFCETSLPKTEELVLINFNYSNPCLFRDDRSGKDVIVWDEHNITNVHGGGIESRNKCIIGIDDTNYDKNVKDYFIPVYRFSKTYRRLKLRFTDFKLPQKDEKIKIIFFGLSLSENDYSYYQSLFDKYDIYNNKNVSICFCYSTGYENYSNAYKMLKTYGSTMDNTDHGNNLITLLGLEQRLKFINIDNPDYDMFYSL